MVIEIRTSQDLLNLLDNNEEFRRAARRALLTDDLLELPDLVREMQQTQRLMIQQIAQLAERMDRMEERQERTEERQDRMEERQDRMEDLLARVVAQQELTVERLDRMDARMDKMDARFEQVDARFEQVDARFEQIVAEMTSMNRRIGDIDGRVRGWELERSAAGRLLPRLAQEYDVARIRAVSADSSRSAVRVRAVWETRFIEAVEAGVDEGRITEDEADALDRTDIVARGRRRVDRAELWFAVQASATLDNNDIERAATGAVALRKLSGDTAVAVVYGRRIAGQQRVRAEELGVAVALDEDGGEE